MLPSLLPSRQLPSHRLSGQICFKAGVDLSNLVSGFRRPAILYLWNSICSCNQLFPPAHSLLPASTGLTALPDREENTNNSNNEPVWVEHVRSRYLI